MGADELCYLPATEVLAKFKEKSLSPVDYMQVMIDRVEASEPIINAVCDRFFDEAMDAAKEAEKCYQSGENLQPLTGLPFAVKEESPVAGHNVSNGLKSLNDNVASATAPVLARSFEAGAIMHVRTTTPEFCAAGICHSGRWGATRSPWNPDYSSGGSSGGSGAVLAAGAAPIASGSDIAGSIRIPAAACGVVGYKPPYGRNPGCPIFNADFYCHEGAMARTVKDTALLQNVMAGPHPLDYATVKPKHIIPDNLGDVKGRRIAYSLDLGYFKIDPEVEKNTLEAVAKLREAGAMVEEVHVPWQKKTLHAAMNYIGHTMGNYIAGYARQHPDMSDYCRAFAEFAKQTTAEDVIEAYATASEMYEQLAPIFDQYEALVCPTTAVPSVPAEFNWLKDRQINDWLESDDPMMLSWCLTYPFNMLSRCPVLALPSGFASSNLMTSVQIVGRTFDDDTVFHIGEAIERDSDQYKRIFPAL